MKKLIISLLLLSLLFTQEAKEKETHPIPFMQNIAVGDTVIIEGHVFDYGEGHCNGDYCNMTRTAYFELVSEENLEAYYKLQPRRVECFKQAQTNPAVPDSILNFAFKPSWLARCEIEICDQNKATLNKLSKGGKIKLECVKKEIFFEVL